MRPTHRATISPGHTLGVMWFARWLLVILLMVDQIGAPLHQHHHDSGVDGHWMATEMHDGGQRHLEEADHHGAFSHSVVSVGVKAELRARDAYPEDAAHAVALLATAWDIPRAADTRPSWPSTGPPPPPSHRSLPPAGRAPPRLT